MLKTQQEGSTPLPLQANAAQELRLSDPRRTTGLTIDDEQTTVIGNVDVYRHRRHSIPTRGVDGAHM